MNQLRSDVLANWKYTQEEWRRFGEYDGRHWHKIIRQSKMFMIAFVILTIIALLIIPIFGFLGIVPWDRYMLGAVFLILLFGGGFVALGAILWLIQRSKLATLMTATGNVTVTLTGIDTNGKWHNWNYNEGLGQRFYDARTMTIAEGKPNQMELLEIRTVANVLTTSPRDTISSCRVPIPKGLRSEADTIVARILEEKARFVNR